KNAISHFRQYITTFFQANHPSAQATFQHNFQGVRTPAASLRQMHDVLATRARVGKCLQDSLLPGITHALENHWTKSDGLRNESRLHCALVGRSKMFVLYASGSGIVCVYDHGDAGVGS